MVSAQLKASFPNLDLIEVGSRADWESLGSAIAPDLVLSSGELSWVSGLELVRLVRGRWVEARVILYQSGREPLLAGTLAEAGVTGCFVYSTERVKELLESVRLSIELLHERRQRTLEALRFEERVEQSLAGVFELSADGRMVFANQVMAGLLGFPSVEELKKSKLDSWHLNPADRQRWQSNAEEGAFTELDLHLRRRNGRMIWGRLRGWVRRDAGGKVLCYHGSLLDITEHYEIRESLRQSATRQALLMDSLPESLLVVDRHSLVVLDSNPAARRLFEYSREEFMQKQLAGLHAAPHLALLTQAEGAGQTGLEEIQCLRKGGGEATAEACVVREIWDGREALLIYYRDVSERRYQERLIRSIAESLPSGWQPDLFWEQLCQSGSRSFDGETFLALCVQDASAQKFRLLAGVGDLGWLRGGDLPVEGEPWTDLFRRRFLGHARGVRKDFPKSVSLESGAAEGFLGLPVADPQGRVHAALCVVAKNPLGKIKLAKGILQIYANLVSHRLGADRILQASERTSVNQPTSESRPQP